MNVTSYYITCRHIVNLFFSSLPVGQSIWRRNLPRTSEKSGARRDHSRSRVQRAPLDLALKKFFLQYQACSHKNHKVDGDRQEDNDKSRKGRGWGGCDSAPVCPMKEPKAMESIERTTRGKLNWKFPIKHLIPSGMHENLSPVRNTSGNDVDAQNIDQSVHEFSDTAGRQPGRIADQEPYE